MLQLDEAFRRRERVSGTVSASTQPCQHHVGPGLGLDSYSKIGVWRSLNYSERNPRAFGESLVSTSIQGTSMITTLLILHAILAVTLLGAITHQAISVWLPTRKTADSFVARVRAVTGASYVNAIVILYVVTAILGGIIYPAYRLSVRPVLQQLDLNVPNGMFELKEHFVAIGLGILPAYWNYWRRSLADDHARTRAVLTVILAFIVWWSFLVGHILNNIQGFGT